MIIPITTLTNTPMTGRNIATSIPTPMPTNIFTSTFMNIATAREPKFMTMVTLESTGRTIMIIPGINQRLMNIAIEG